MHLAQVNIARMLHPLDDPRMTEFVLRLDEINRLADQSAGFIWRLQGDAGNATYLRPYDDDRILFNLSVWHSVEDLRRYVFESAHADIMRERRRWFERDPAPTFAMWWISAGSLPEVSEAKARLEHLRREGESDAAFSFRSDFAAAPGRIRVLAGCASQSV